MDDPAIELFAAGLMSMLVSRTAIAIVAGCMWGWYWGVGLWIICGVATKLMTKCYTHYLLESEARARGDRLPK